MQIVVAKFKEDVGWLWRDFSSWDRICYDKSAGVIPNVGFEAHTFLHHFVERYDDLAEVTICMQGDPVPHLPGGLRGLRQALDKIDPMAFSFMPLAKSGSWQQPDGSPHHPGLGEANERLWRLLKGCPPPSLWYSWYGGQFAVHRDSVRRYPREFWQRARDAVVTKNDACAMERLWGAIFP